MLETPKLLLKLDDKKYLILYMLILVTLIWLTLQQPGRTAPVGVPQGPAPG